MSMETQPAFDRRRADAFAGRLLGTLNESALSLMLSIGHRTGLFETLSTLPPSTCTDIAARAGLDERYVREWLGAMVTARVVEVSGEAPDFRYALPPEHAAFLTRAAGPDNVALYAQFVPLLAAVEDDLIHCFRHGGGVPYAKYPRLHDVMAEDQTVLTALDGRIPAIVPGWDERLSRGCRLLDVGCGRGRAIIRLASRYPASRFVGMDLSEAATAEARREAAEAGCRNVEFVPRDLSTFDETAEPEAFDLVTTFDAIHDQAKPLQVLRGIHRTLKPDGVYLMQDISGTSHVDRDVDHPLGTFLYTVSCMHCMTVSLAQGGEGLGAMWGEEKTREYLRRAGFREVVTHHLPQDPLNNWYVVRK